MPAASENGGRAILWGPLLVVAAVVGFGFGGASVYFYLHYYAGLDEMTDTSAESSEEIDKVVALGRIEPKDGVVPVGVPTPDRIRDIPNNVYEGATVKKDEVLTILDSEALRKLELDLAKLQLKQAEKRLDAIEKNGKAQIRVQELRGDQIKELEPLEREALESKIKFLKAEVENAKKNTERYANAGDTISKQDIEKQDLALQQVQAELEATQSQLRQLRKSNDLKRDMAKAQLLAAEAELKQTKSAIDLDLLNTHIDQAKERLKDTRLLAPRDGKILRIYKHEGELVRGEPILEMANVERMIVRAEVYETDIKWVKLDQEAAVTSHIFTEKKDPLKGKVIWIASSVGKSRLVPLDPRAAVDRRVVDVKVELSDPGRVADLIGHQVHVSIEIKPAKGQH
jgi:HlyD family secretion protein